MATGQSRSAPCGSVGVGRLGGGAASGMATVAAKISSASNTTTSSPTTIARRTGMRRSRPRANYAGVAARSRLGLSIGTPTTEPYSVHEPS
jgi:hypothetical protein